MVQVLTSLLVHSAALLLLTTVLFWAVVGAAAARRSGRSRALGAVVGGLVPGLGALVLLVLPRPVPRSTVSAALPVSPAAGPAARTWSPSPAPVAVAPTWSGTAPAWSAPPPPALSGWGSGGAPAAGGAPPPPPSQPVPHGSVALPGHPAVAPERGVARTTGAVLAGVAAVVLLVAATQPLLEVQAPVVGDALGLTQSAGAVGPLLGAALALAALGALQVLRPRGTWPVLAAAVGATALLVSLQVMLLDGAARDLLRALGERVPAGSAVQAGAGSRLLLLGGLLTYGWSVLGIVACPRAGKEPAHP